MNHQNDKQNVTLQYLLSVIQIPENDLKQLTRIAKKTILDTSDVCFLFNRSKSTIKRWRDKHFLLYSEVGTSKFYQWPSIKALLTNKGRKV